MWLEGSWLFGSLVRRDKSVKFRKRKNGKSLLVQLATGTKRKVVEKCPIMLDGFASQANFNVLPLGSYDVLIGMDWLEKHRAKLDCYKKVL